ncbi:MAG: NAD(P)-dependent oxidoreductase [Smithella sp.]|nr:NAD(P)-dependent oxidoreductase [Smithella sp.]
MKLSILGARGQIAGSLISLYKGRGELSNLALYSRSPESLAEESKGAKICPSKDFAKNRHEVIINCIGVPNLKGVKNSGAEIFETHESWDNLILAYLKKHPDALYISLSSGAVYGKNFSSPVSADSCFLSGVTEISPADFYAISKLNGEAKHRSLEKCSIVDLRIFSYISRFIDFDSNFLVAEMMKAIKDKQVFMTDDNNICRDYLHPEDMLQIINLIIGKWKDTGFINAAFDTYSKAPVSKLDMLKALYEKFNLQYIVKQGAKPGFSPTGFKMNYYSTNKKLEKMGYKPQYSSVDAILQVLSEVL